MEKTQEVKIIVQTGDFTCTGCHLEGTDCGRSLITTKRGKSSVCSNAQFSFIELKPEEYFEHLIDRVHRKISKKRI